MSKYLQLIEGYAPKEFGENSWPFESLCVAYTFYGKQTFQLDTVKKLMIHFGCDGKVFDPEPVLGVLSLGAAAGDRDKFLKLISDTEKFIHVYQCLAPVLVNFAKKFSCNVQEVLDLNRRIEDAKFQFNGIVSKKKSKDCTVELKWSFSKYLEYWVEVVIGGITHKFSVAKILTREIDHSKNFSKIEITNNSIYLHRKGGEEYWFIDLASLEIQYFTKRALEGNAHAQYNLGQMYLNQNLLIENKELALIWLKKAAMQGFSRAESLIKNITI
jgi:Sel1 repeat